MGVRARIQARQRLLGSMSFIALALVSFLHHSPAKASESSSPKRPGQQRALTLPPAFDDVLLDGYSWSACPTPITWSADLSALEPLARERELRNLTWAFDQWSLASGLNFEYRGRQAMSWDESARQLTPTRGAPLTSRHILIDFLPESESVLLRGLSLGFGGPSYVLVSQSEIVNGFAVFESEYVNADATPSLRARKHLFLHEIGHSLGLGHSTDDADVMFSVANRNTELSADDATSVVAHLAPCAKAPESPATAMSDELSR